MTIWHTGGGGLGSFAWGIILGAALVAVLGIVRRIYRRKTIGTPIVSVFGASAGPAQSGAPLASADLSNFVPPAVTLVQPQAAMHT